MSNDDKDFITTIKDSVKDLANKVGLTSDEKENSDDDKTIVSSIKDTAKDLASKAGLTSHEDSDKNDENHDKYDELNLHDIHHNKSPDEFNYDSTKHHDHSKPHDEHSNRHLQDDKKDNNF